MLFRFKDGYYLIEPLFVSVLKALERFLDERFRFLQFDIFTICPAERDRNEGISL